MGGHPSDAVHAGLSEPNKPLRPNGGRFLLQTPDAVLTPSGLHSAAAGDRRAVIPSTSPRRGAWHAGRPGDFLGSEFASGFAYWPADALPLALAAISSCLPSQNSSMALSVKAGMSSGLREVTRPSSTTTSSSTHSPPALTMSVCRL